MELKLTRQPLFINDVLIDQNVEQPIECDALLPDYCPDIVRILKCSVAPAVTGRRASPGKLELEGMAVITVYYVSTGEGIAHGEYKVPFSRIVEMKADHPAPVLSITARADYVNCRAVNQRRLDIRGALVITVRGTGSREEQVVAEGSGMGLQVKREQSDAARLLGCASRETRITETLDLTYGKPPIQAIVRTGASARVTECKQVAGKAVLRGELNIHVLYQATTGGFDQVEYTLPTSAICELDGLDDASVCDVWQQVGTISAEPAAAEDGEYRRIALDAVVESQARGWQPYTAHFCSDCYSTTNQCTFRNRTVVLPRVCGGVKETIPYKETLPLPENVDKVVDLWCEKVEMIPRAEAGGPVVEGKITVAMFARMTDGQLYYFDKALETSCKVPCEAEGAALEGRLSCQNCAFTFAANDALEVRCDLELTGVLTTQGKAVLLDDIQVDEKKPKESASPAGLYLYLADPGETLWDIAKRYNTNIDKITGENPEENGGQERRVLLIPVL
jgi:hypothetical protein